MVEWIEKTDLADEIKVELQRLFDESQEIDNSDEWAWIALEEELQAIAFEYHLNTTTLSHLRGCLLPREEEESSVETTEHVFNDETTNIQVSRRYQEGPLLGLGGMGEVRRVYDKDLFCTLAMKVIHQRHLKQPQLVERFRQEARILARLQHPSIPPVHELGRLEDGRHFFTMQEIRGRSLSQILRQRREGVQEVVVEWSIRRLLTLFQKVCETVAYAHSQGVIHRDLKPSNIMTGQFGAVLVVDWGLAKMLNQRETDLVDIQQKKVPTLTTLYGTVQGTPAYMSPEQAKGDPLDQRSDVYSLGAILYEILTDQPPFQSTDFEHESQEQLLNKLRNFSPEPILNLVKHPIPGELVEACERAILRNPEERFQSASDLAMLIQEWLDGAKQREKALGLVYRAAQLQKSAIRQEQEADLLQTELKRQRIQLSSNGTEELKQELWSKEDKIAQYRLQASLFRGEAEQLLHASLSHKSDLEEAHLALIDLYLQEHARAEVSEDEEARLKAEFLLQHHVVALNANHPRKSGLLKYLEGTGLLSLTCKVEGAEFILEEYKEQYRRLVPHRKSNLGNSCKNITIPVGSYRIRIRAQGHQDVLYPIKVARQQEWTTPNSLHIFPTGKLDRHEIYVPEGWCWIGAGSEVYHAWEKEQVYVGGFVIQRYPITHTEFLQFLNALVDQGERRLAARCVPKQGEQLIYGQLAGGHYFLCPDSKGERINPMAPVTHIDWFSARAYGRWYASCTGKKWRLPTGVEWEKAARGVDGRAAPWGNYIDPDWCAIQGLEAPGSVDGFPLDHSPYGVRGMAGNVADWVLDDFDWCPGVGDIVPSIDSELPGATRGGHWNQRGAKIHLAERRLMLRTERSSSVGFRLAYEVDQDC